MGLLRLLRPTPGRLIFAARLALVCALTTLVVEIYQTPEPALTVYVVFFLNKPDRGTSLLLSAMMLIVYSLTVATVLLLAKLVIDEPAWRVFTMAAISFGLLFLASASKLRPVGGIIALIVAYALDLLGTVHGGEIATRALLYAWLFIAIPVGVSLVVNLALAPAPHRFAVQAIIRRLHLATAMLQAPNEEIREDFTECLREGNTELLKWLKFALIEKSVAPAEIAVLRRAALASFEILVLIDVMDQDEEDAFPAPLRERLAGTLAALSQRFDMGGLPADSPFENDLGETSLTPRALKILAGLRKALASFDEAEPVAEQPGGHTHEKQSGGFFLPDAFTNPEHVHYALKTTAAAMFCYILYSLLDWPGIHTSLITCYIVSLGTTAETVEKLSLRISGCLIGAAIGTAAIVMVIPSLTSIGVLMILVFLGALASAWVAAGSPRIAYAGFQMAFAFFLCVIQGSGPAFDLTIARDRVIGILLGNAVVYLVFTHLWSVSVAERIDPAIAAILRRLGALLAAASESARVAQAAEAHTLLAAIEQDLDLAPYEPASIRPTLGWRKARRAAADAMGTLIGPLLLTGNEDRRCTAGIAQRLDGLAARLDAAEAPSSSADNPITAPGEVFTPGLESVQLPFHAAIMTGLKQIDEALAPECEPDRKIDYASA